MSTIEERLAEIDADYMDTEISETTRLPDGDHDVVIFSSQVVESKFGDLQLELKFRNADDATVTKWHTIPDKSEKEADRDRYHRQIGWLKADLKRLGYEGHLAGLAAAAPGFVGTKCHIKAGTTEDGKYRRVYINEVSGRDEAVKPPPPPATTPDATQSDDVPF